MKCGCDITITFYKIPNGKNRIRDYPCVNASIMGKKNYLELEEPAIHFIETQIRKKGNQISELLEKQIEPEEKEVK